MRNPKRTAATAAALMIGLTLVAALGVVGTSLKASINHDVDKTAKAELILTGRATSPTGFSPPAADAVRAVPGVPPASEFGAGRARINGGVHYITPIDPATIGKTLDLGVRSGSRAPPHNTPTF